MQSCEYRGAWEGMWPFIPICSCPCLYGFSLSCANLSRCKMWYLLHSQNNLVINNLVNKCFQQRKVLLIAFCVISNPSNIYKTKHYSFLKPMVTILSRSPVLHKIQKKKKKPTCLPCKAFSTLFCCYFSLKRKRCWSTEDLFQQPMSFALRSI